MKEISANVFNLVKITIKGLFNYAPFPIFSATNTTNSDASNGLKKNNEMLKKDSCCLM